MFFILLILGFLLRFKFFESFKLYKAAKQEKNVTRYEVITLWGYGLGFVAVIMMIIPIALVMDWLPDMGFLTELLFDLLIVFINREYKGLFVFSGFLVFSILINYLLYQLIYVYLYLRNKYKYYQKILSSQRRKEVKAKIIDDLNIETFEKIKFNSYLVIDEEDNKIRILCKGAYI